MLELRLKCKKQVKERYFAQEQLQRPGGVGGGEDGEDGGGGDPAYWA